MPGATGSGASGHGSWQPAGPAILFAPADRPERFAKAAERADMVILDLEDGCRAENRPAARDAIRDCDLDPATTIVRINPPETDDYAADLEMLRDTEFRQVMLPKASSAAQAEELVAALGGAAQAPEQAPAQAPVQVIALVETPLGVLRAEELAASDAVAALFWGAEDLVAGMSGTSSRFTAPEAELAPGRIHAGAYRTVAAHARSTVHLAASAYGKASLDSVYVDIADANGLAAEATDAAALGFAATVCIHPGQVATIRAAYRPSEKEIDWATRLLAEAAKNSGAFSFDGRMVDAPLFRQAEAIARRAGVGKQ
nr:CoA ester lyase [Corynebacterium lactis]